MSTASCYDIILFDVGGVLVDFQGSKRLFELAGGENTPEKLAEFRRVTTPWVRKLESGACTVDEFTRGHLAEWPSGLTPQGLVEELESWPLSIYPGALELLEALRENFTLACLSNTNPIHWPLQRDRMGLGKYFQHQYVSYEIGGLKPDAAVFAHVIDDLSCDPRRVLFLDDREENVEAAVNAGFDSRCVRGIEDTRETLRKMNLTND